MSTRQEFVRINIKTNYVEILTQMTSPVLVYNVQHGIREDHLQVKHDFISQIISSLFAAPATLH